MQSFTVTEAEVKSAIKEIRNHSACPQNSLPALVIKKCQISLTTPLKLFFQKSFDLGIVPKLYKTQQIIPIFKKGLKTSPQNYRPISLTPHIIKIFERIVRTKLVRYFETNSMLNNNQHGFRKKHSCLTQLVAHTTYILESLVEGKEVDTIYLDYSKAFDRIDHCILLQKLKFYQLPPKYINWIKSFLKDRTQFVYHNEARSFESAVGSGVPQGSVLGPLLFIVFINDLVDHISSSQVYTFADDTKIVHQINTSSDFNCLQSDLNSVLRWSSQNNMLLNKDKFELISHAPPANIKSKELFSELPFSSTYLNYCTGDDQITPSQVVRDLGLFINSSLTWDNHINKLCSGGKRLCGWILNVFYSRDSDILLVLFKAIGGGS